MKARSVAGRRIVKVVQERTDLPRGEWSLNALVLDNGKTIRLMAAEHPNGAQPVVLAWIEDMPAEDSP